MTVEDALRTLDIKPPVSENSLKTAYRNLAKRFHPDRYASYDRQIWAAEKFIRVKQAYDALRKVDLSSLQEIKQGDSSAPYKSEATSRASVFDQYSDQSDFTERDFIAWVSVCRFCGACLRAIFKPLVGPDFLESAGFQSTMGCLFLLLMIPFAIFVVPMIYALVMCFICYITVQKLLIAFIEKVCRMKIGPDSTSLFGHLLYLGILGGCAWLAVAFAVYVLPTQKNREWLADVLTWSFSATLVLTWLLESSLFVKARLLRKRLTSELEAAIWVTNSDRVDAK